jgi:hypothetical protein
VGFTRSTRALSAVSPGTAPRFSDQFTKSLRQESMLVEDRYREANCRLDCLIVADYGPFLEIPGAK